MKTLLQKFFSLPLNTKGKSAFDPDLNEFFREDTSKKPKVAIGVQPLGYTPPPNNDYQKWCQDQIDQKMKSYKLTQYEKVNNSNGPLTLSFNNVNGVRDYRLTPGDGFHESGPRVRESN